MRAQQIDVRTTRRQATAACVVIAPVLVGLVRAITPTVNGDKGAEVVNAFAHHMQAARLSMVASVLAAAVLPFFVLGLHHLTSRRAPVLSGVGAVLAIAGWAMLPVLTASDVVAYELARHGGDVGLWDHFTNNPAIAMSIVIFIVAHEVGMILLGAALWRTHEVPAWAGVAVMVGVAAHLVGVVSGVRGIDVAGFAALIAGSIVAARAILARSNDDWDLAPTNTASGGGPVGDSTSTRPIATAVV